MTKIYIVTSGSYSDYMIEAVFSSKKKAQAYIDMVKSTKNASFYNDERIEEHELDPHNIQDDDKRKCFFVRIAKSGDIVEISKEYSFGDTTGFDSNLNMYTHCLANDAEHAIKIASERWAGFLSQYDWPADWRTIKDKPTEGE